MRCRSGRERDILAGQAGFTLMEMMVVVSIIGILAVAFGASFLSWREQYKAETDIKKIHGAFMDAKINALKDRRYLFINIPTVATGENHIIRIYRDTDPDPLKPGNGTLEIGTDEQVGPDIELDYRLDIQTRYRHLWYNAQGHLWHSGSSDPALRDFDILLKQWEKDEMTESDINCLRVTPPLYVSGGFWDGSACQLK